MQLFLDTANVAEIRQAVAAGIVRGVTTNPSIIAREKKPFETCLREILAVDPTLTVLAEVLADDTEGMIAEARDLARLCDRIVVKIPMTGPGLAAVRVLAREKIRTTVTLVFSANQAIAASCAGADYVAPFVGRLDDIDAGGIDLVRQIKNIFVRQDTSTQIIAASIRTPQSVADLFAAGCDIVTMPGKILLAMLDHPLTAAGLKKFREDWQTVPAAT
jgi:transaldolase